MNMRRAEHPWVDERIKTFHGDLRTSKAKMVEALQALALCGRREQ
jgi:hypothetical protein